MKRHDVVIVGAGPAGLSAAKVIRRRGVRDVLVIEREVQAGGLPLSCTHVGFGLGQFLRLYSGPQYAGRLLREAGGVQMWTGASVVAIHPGGELVVASAQGLLRIAARVVLLATGIRETPRPPRLVSGARPWGLLTTGALQRFLRETGRLPCRNPVIIGTEWVSYSALLTLHHEGLRAVAMLEERERVTVPRAASMLACRWYCVPVLTGARLLRVHGDERVEGVEIEHGGQRRFLDCDAVLFTGRFVPEAGLARLGHLEFDAGSGGPRIDQYWRCSDPAFFAAGNVLRAVESSGRCAREGEAAGEAMADALAGRLRPPLPRVVVQAAPPLCYVCPGALVSAAGTGAAPIVLGARVSRAVRGTVCVVRNGEMVHRRSIDALPGRKLAIRLPRNLQHGLRSLELRIDEPASAAGAEP